ncbi:MAG TPA: hypothetical protein VGK20_16630 [Candidatus Binatia bacterium]|jgi:hypothetical protein
MSSTTLTISIHSGRATGAVIESSIGSMHVGEVFDVAFEDGETPVLPVAGPFDRVVATIEAEAAAFRVLTLPFRDRRRAAQAVGPALEEHVPYDLDDGVLAWDFAGPAPGSAAGATVLAAIVDSARIEQARQRLAGAGIEAAPERLLWAPSVILAAYRRAVGEDATFTAVDAGPGGAVIASFDAGRLCALRVVAPCDEELLSRNISWSLATIGADEARIVVGGTSASRVSRSLAARHAGAHIEELPANCPVEGLGARDWRSDTTLVGLLLTASGEGIAPLLDFAAEASSLFGLAIVRDLQDEARPLVRWAAAALVLGIVAIGIDYVQLFAERRELAARAEQIYSAAMPSPSGGSARKLKMEMRLKELNAKAEAAAHGGAASPLTLLSALSRDVPKDLDVVVDSVDHAPAASKVTGHAGSFESVTKMQEALQKGGAFSRVEVKDVHAAVTGGGVDFLLELGSTAREGGT